MIRKIHYYLFSGTALFIEKIGIPLIGRINPYLLGVFIATYLKPAFLNQIENKNSKNILCHNRLTFQRDLEVLKQGNHFNYIEFNSLCIGQILSLYIPTWMRHQIIFKRYMNQDKHLHIKTKIEKFAIGFITTIQKYIKIDCALMSGIDYYQDYCFHLAYQKLNIPFVAMFYENHTIPTGQIVAPHLYTDFEYTFMGDAVAAMSHKTASIFEKSEVCSPSKIHTTGAPRLDPLYKKMLSTIYGRKAVLFSYPGDEYGACLNFINVVHEFAEASLKIRNMDFVIKCKNKKHKKLVLSYLDGLDHRVQILININIFDLLSEARSVISFNSLTCLESLLSKAHVYIPHYADSRLPDVQLQISPNTLTKNVSGLTFLYKPGDIIKYLEIDSQKKSNQFDQQSRVDLFKEYFFISDRISNRENLENLIESVIANYE
jgi:hypothetical protein